MAAGAIENRIDNRIAVGRHNILAPQQRGFGFGRRRVVNLSDAADNAPIQLFRKRVSPIARAQSRFDMGAVRAEHPSENRSDNARHGVTVHNNDAVLTQLSPRSAEVDHGPPYDAGQPEKHVTQPGERLAVAPIHDNAVGFGQSEPRKRVEQPIGLLQRQPLFKWNTAFGQSPHDRGNLDGFGSRSITEDDHLVCVPTVFASVRCTLRSLSPCTFTPRTRPIQ